MKTLGGGYGVLEFARTAGLAVSRRHGRHPIGLVVCADDMEVELLAPPSSEFASEATRLLQLSPFQRVSVVKVTDAEKLVWFTCSRT